MVLVDAVQKSFGAVHAVQGISFELRAGQVAGLLGPNGAGKSTTIRMIAGYLMPDAGRVVIAGHDTLSAPARARTQLGYLPEGNPLYAEMRVAEYLGFRGRLFGMPAPLRRKAAEWAIERCWLKDVRDRRIGTLSKGYKQRVGLAAALLHNPKVLILDEPTNGLDPTQIHETRRLVRELASDRTMLISTHILPEVERLCDRVLIVAGGRLHADGSPDELTRALAGRYVIESREPRSGDNDRAAKALSNLPQVLQVDQRRAEGPPGWTRWQVSAKAGAPDLREPIALACAQAGLVLRELRPDHPTLERVFMDVLDRAAGVRDTAATATHQQEAAA